MENKFTINEQKVLEVFLDYPTTSFSTREIARLKKITHPTVAAALQKLRRLCLVEKSIEKNKSMVGKSIAWKANQGSEEYRAYKRIANLQRIYASNLIKKISSETAPNAIVLFGSYSRGEDTEGSDIDILIVSKEKKMNIKIYEQKLHRKINLTFVQNMKEIKKEFLQNIINGVILYGYLEAI